METDRTVAEISEKSVLPAKSKYRKSEKQIHSNFLKSYFVVIDVAGKKKVLGWELQGKVTLSTAGKIAQSCWIQISKIRLANSRIVLGPFSVMPDHIRGIISVSSYSVLKKVIGVFKFHSARKISGVYNTLPCDVWEKRNYIRRTSP